MNFSALVKSRLAKLGRGQNELARAVHVTDSYISQLLTRRKAPPSSDRTDIYGRMETFLQLERGELGRLVEIERAEEMKRRLKTVPEPLFKQFRALVLKKCAPDAREAVRAVFDAQPFGTLERLVASKLLEVVQRVARRELDSDDWMRLAASVGGRTREEMRVIVLEFLDTDVFQVSKENCVDFLDPLVESWSVNLDTLRLDITLNRKLVSDPRVTFTFVEGEPEEVEEHGLAEFMKDPELSGSVTAEEVKLLRGQRPRGRRPNKLYYYRALQNLRDPLHFFDRRASG